MLEQSRKELVKARESLEEIRKAKLFSSFEEAWVQVLIRLERLYDKAVSEMRPVPHFLSWNSKYARERKTDPLLSYIHQARHADQHTVQNILEHQQEKVVLPPGAAVRVEVVKDSNGELGYQFTNIGEVIIQVEPAKAILLSFKNRGVNYHPPKKHLGSNIEKNTIPEILEMALNWYEKYLSAIEPKFSPRRAQ